MKSPALRLTAFTLVALGLAAAAPATVVGPPSATGSYDPFPAGATDDYPASRATDGTELDYASAGGGASTYIEWDFGSTVEFDHVILVGRDSPDGSDRTAQATLTYDSGSDTFATNSDPGRSGVYWVGATSTQTVRWDVDVTGAGATNNTGLMEAIFLMTPEHSRAVSGVSAYNSFAAFNGNYAASNAVNGVVGRSGVSTAGIEYASSGGGANMFVDFDLGAMMPITGFDFIDRIGAVDQVTDFNLVFSNVANFATNVGVFNYTKGANTVALGDAFDPINARYVRLEANAAGLNSGMSEMFFYAHGVLDNPTIVTPPSQFNTGQFAVEHLFDDQLTGSGSDWAALGEGPTTMVLDFGQQVFIDGINWANRNDSGNYLADLPASIVLTFSDDLSFGGSDAVVTLDSFATDQLLHAYMFGQLYSARYVQMVFTGDLGIAGNVGGAQLEFLGVVPTPAALPAGLLLMGAIAGRRRLI